MMLAVRLGVLVCAALTAATCGAQCPGGVCPPPSGWQSAPPSQPVGRVVSLPPEIAGAICRVRNDVGSNVSLGSGSLVAVIGNAGYLLTCNHLFSDGTGQLSVQFPNRPATAATIVSRDQAHDLALLKTAPPNAGPLRHEPNLTTPLTAAGLGSDGKLRAVTGQVVGRSTPQGARYASLLIGAAVRSGDSGGPVINQRAELVGVVWGARGSTTYATVGEPVRQILSQIPPPSDGMVALKPPTGVPADKPACDCPCDGDCVRRSEFAAIQDRLNELATRQTNPPAATPAESAFPLTTVQVVLGALGIGGPAGLAWLVAKLAWRRTTSQHRGPGGPRPPDFQETSEPAVPMEPSRPPADPR